MITAAPTADPMVTTPWTLSSIDWETLDTFTLRLHPKHGENGQPYSFEPGQFNMLYVFGVGEVPISICSDPSTPHLIAHTTRNVGTVTRAMGKIEVGENIGVRGPFGSTWPMDKARGNDVLIVAGGIGLAPLRPAMYEILNNRDDYERVVLLYGARTQEDLLYQSELQEWRGHLDLEVYVTVDRSTGDWHGNVGVVPHLIQRAPMDPDKLIVMICGPEIMMRYCMPELKKRGVNEAHIYVSLERNMKCAVGHCGHCQLGSEFVCMDGPVFPYQRVNRLLNIKEL